MSSYAGISMYFFLHTYVTIQYYYSQIVDVICFVKIIFTELSYAYLQGLIIIIIISERGWGRGRDWCGILVCHRTALTLTYVGYWFSS